MKTAYSYIRFSSPDQAAGDSLRRQTQMTAAWCARNKVRLDESLTLRDLGVSAFRGKHRNGDKHALAAFLKLVEKGKVAKGSYLVIENLDRLTREDERTALRLWLDILDHGINIVTLSPEAVYRHDRTDSIDVTRAIMELALGHAESQKKSERVGAAWREKLTQAQNGKPLGRKCPGWIKLTGGKYELIPERAAVVATMFEMATRGNQGVEQIARTLNAARIKPFGCARKWSRGTVAAVLNSRNTIGEYQPKSQGKPFGQPVANYYPAAVTEETWWQAQRAIKDRTVKGRGNPGEFVTNLFTGLLVHARDGESMRAAQFTGAQGRQFSKSVLEVQSRRSGGYSETFQYIPFERAALKFLRELKPADLLPGRNGDELSERLKAAEAMLTGLTSRKASILDDISSGRDYLAEALPKLSDNIAGARKLVEELRAELAAVQDTPLDYSQEILALLDKAKDSERADLRRRLKGAIRGVVQRIYVLIVIESRYQRHLLAEVHLQSGGVRRWLLTLNSHHTCRSVRMYLLSEWGEDGIGYGWLEPWAYTSLANWPKLPSKTRKAVEAGMIEAAKGPMPEWLNETTLDMVRQQIETLKKK